MKQYLPIFILLFLIKIQLIEASPKNDTLLFDNLKKIKLIKNDKLIIKKIEIIGNKKTKRNIITRELTIKEGSEVLKEDFISILMEDERKVINTDLFNEVEFRIDIIEENLVLLNIKVIESIYWIPSLIFELSDRNFNDWWVNFNHDFNRINYGLGLRQYNLSGRGDIAEFLFRLGFIKEFYGSYYLPYLSKKQKGGIEIDFNYMAYDHIEYNTVDYIPLFYKSNKSLLNSFSTSIEYSHRESFYNYHYFKLEYINIEKDDYLNFLNGNYLNDKNINNVFNLSYEFDRDFRDIKNYPLDGFRLNVSINKYGLGIFKDVNNWKARIYYSNYFKLKNKFYYSFNISSFVSSKNQKYLMYEYTDQIRGFEKYLIHGFSNITYQNSFKKRIFNGNIKRDFSEYFRKIKNIPIDIYLKIFYDSGIIWKYESNQDMFLNNTYIFSFGVGLDIVTLKNLSFTSEVSRNSQKETNLSLKLGADF